MGSLLGENRLILFLRQQSRLVRFLITFSITVFISFFWFVFSYTRLSFLIRSEKKIKKNHVHDIVLLQKNIMPFVQIESHYVNLLRDMENLLYTNSFQETLNKMLDCLQESNLICSDVSPIVTKKKDFYKKKYITWKTKGNFENIFSFFRKAENILKDVKFKKIVFLKNDEGDILLEAKVRIVNYRKKAIV
jgi:hypothetical protein